MKITGSRSSVTFDLENGYIIKASGELLTGGSFVVFTDSMKRWEPPYEKEVVREADVYEIIQQVKQCMGKDKVQLLFE